MLRHAETLRGRACRGRSELWDVDRFLEVLLGLREGWEARWERRQRVGDEALCRHFLTRIDSDDLWRSQT